MAFKRFNILSLIVVFMFLSEASYAQEIPVRLEQALTSGKVKEFSQIFDERVDITIDEDKFDCSKQQAQVVLNEFLEQYEEVEFTMIHQGTSKNQSKYYVAKMTTETESYRVYLYVKLINGQDYIQAIKFEEQ